jgi:hypothetical protein
MPATTVAVFDDVNEAQQVLEELVVEGVPRDDISIIANRDRCGPALGPVEDIGAGGRAGAGAAIGGAAGFAAGLFALAIPGIGPVLALGPLAAGLTGAGVGAAAGGIIGRFTKMGVSEEDAGCLCEAVRRGGIVLTVDSTDETAARVTEIMGRHRLVDLDACVAEWRQGDWSGFDPNADPRATSSPGPLGAPAESLPFDPQSLRPRKRAERSARAVRSYLRIR